MDPYAQQNQNVPLRTSDFQAMNAQQGQGVSFNVGAAAPQVIYGMVQQQMPGGPTGNQASGDYFSIRHENMGFHIPAVCHDLCFKKLFPRKYPRHSAPFVCPNCNQNVNSVCKTEIGCGLLLCTLIAICCNPCCFWVPASLDDCYDVTHNCPSCRKKMGEENFFIGASQPNPPGQAQGSPQRSPQRP